MVAELHRNVEKHVWETVQGINWHIADDDEKVVFFEREDMFVDRGNNPVSHIVLKNGSFQATIEIRTKALE